MWAGMDKAGQEKGNGAQWGSGAMMRGSVQGGCSALLMSEWERGERDGFGRDRR
jgi:hypothetical protein